MLQVARAILNEPQDQTTLHLIYCNHTREDILLKEALDNLASSNPNRFKVTYTLTREVPENWNGERGRVDAEMIKKYLPPPSEATLITTCGPSEFDEVMTNNLTQLGYTKEMICKF